MTASSSLPPRPTARFVGAIDQGTTSTRFMVFDRAGNCVASAQREHAQHFPQPGWVEHDALEIWHCTQTVIGQVVRDAGIAPGDLMAIGIANQRETTVLWDRRNGQPVHRALVWQDTRANDRVRQYVAQYGVEAVRARTGLPLASYFSALKLQWLLDTVPGTRALAEAGHLCFGTIESWLTWNLTGGAGRALHVTDVTNASRTQLMNLATLDWDEELLDLFRIPRAVLPRIVSTSNVLGDVATGALRGVPIAGLVGDQQAALIGQGCFRAGQTKNTYGTGCFMLMNTGEQPVASRHGLLTTVAFQLGDQPARYALEGSIAVTGSLVQWLRDNLQIISHSDDVEKLAAQVTDNGDVYFVPAFSGLYAPHWQEGARGIIAGLTRYATRAHIARAALEACAYQTREVLEAMEQDTGTRIPELRVDGGMIRNELLMQFQADILDLPVVRTHTTESTAFGAACAAGLATGYWQSPEDITRAIGRRWVPCMDATRREHLYSSWKKALQRSLNWIA
ncbi:MAG: glycerol kinase GlpK [Pseudomonadota bacterium]